MARPPVAALAWTCCSSLLDAQTFVVDASNGPGTQFTSIAAAVTSVPDGATLLVRQGSYQSFTVNQKGLTILADAGVVLTGTVRVENTLTAQATILAGLGITAAASGHFGLLELANCAGRVLLEQITLPVTLSPQVVVGSPFAQVTYGLWAVNCSQLLVRSSSLTNTTTAQSTAVFESCILRGVAATVVGGLPASATSGLTSYGGSVQLASGTQVLGGGNGISQPAAAIFDAAVELTILDGSVASGPAGPGGAPAIVSGVGIVRIDPRVVLSASNGTWISGGTIVSTPMPMVACTSAAPGGAMNATVTSAVGDAVVLCVGLPGAPTSIPGLPTAVWLDLPSISTQAIGLQQPGAPVVGSLAVPGSPALRGAAVLWQAATWNAAAGWSITNPSLGLVR